MWVSLPAGKRRHRAYNACRLHFRRIIYVQMKKQLQKASPSAAEALHEADEGEPLLDDHEDFESHRGDDL